MKKLLPVFAALLACSAALAEAPVEPPVEANPLGTIIFAVLFFGSCVVFGWMVWRKSKGPQDKQQ